MKKLVKREFEKITESDDLITKQYKELHHFALTEKGRKVLTAGPDYVKTGNYVGVIQTKSGLLLEILPKIYEEDETNKTEETRVVLMRMLRTMRNLPKYKYIDFANLSTARMPVYEIFISMFLKEVLDIVKKGIKSSYIPQEDNLGYLRGKLVVGEHIRRNITHKEKFYVRYDEYIQDIPMNRIIKTALVHLKKLSRYAENHQKINELLFVFDGVNTTINVDHEYKQVIKDRTTDYYQKALAWAMLFLNGKSFAMYAGSSIAFALLFPMEKVFESYVYHCLKKSSTLTDIVGQSTKYSLAIRDEKDIFKIKPDIVALDKTQEIRYILDAKWKLVDQSDKDSKFKIAQADMYQLLSYAKIYQSQEAKEVKLMLLYPKTSLFSKEIIMKYNDSEKTEIKMIPFDIEESLKDEDHYCDRLFH